MNTPNTNRLPRELTTQEAAEFLAVSQAYLITLLDEGKIPFCIAGAGRQVPYEALKVFKEREEKARGTALDALAAEAQELGMGY